MRVPRPVRTVVKRIPGAMALHGRYAAWKVRTRRARAWDRAQSVIVSFPKSGRTWLAAMLGKVFADLAGRPFSLDTPGVLFTHDGVDKAHLPLAVDPQRYAGKRVVFLVRDPRDVLVSYYAHRTRRDSTFTGPIDRFVRHPGYGAERLIGFMNAWWHARQTLDTFLLLRYEDLRADPRAQLARLLEFLGVDAPARVIDDAVAFTTFEKMQAMERAGLFDDARLIARDPSDLESYKVRRGAVGGFRSALSDDDLRYVDRFVGTLAPGLGYAVVTEVGAGR